MDTMIENFNKVILFFIIYTILFLVFFKTLGYTLPFVLAILFAFMLQKPTKYLIKRFRIKNSIASLLTTMIFFAILTSLLSWGIVTLTSEMIQLGKNAGIYISDNSVDINNFFNSLKDYYNNLDPSILNAIENNLSTSVSKISNITVVLTTKIGSSLISLLASIPYIIMVILFTLLTTYFFTKDISNAKNKVFNALPNDKTTRLSYIFSESKKMMGNYLLSYLLIISITFLETLIGFLVLKVKYAVILSIVSAVFDILPLLGIGSIYVPLAIIYLLSHNYFTAIGIVILYVLVSVIRQIVEPKIVSSSLGIHPVPILAAIFIGLKANGIAGMFFCIFLVVFYTILKKVKVL